MSQSITPSQDERPVASPYLRQAKQFGLLLAGTGFLATSIAVARRSVVRRRLDIFPSFYTSNRTASKFDASDRQMLAVQALGLATLNVMSFGVMLVGGISWAFDISSIEELRQRTRTAMRRPTNISAEDEKEAEREMEKMMENLMDKLGFKKPDNEAPGEPPADNGGRQ
ncbi:unnamed protein product [Clonostachys rosea]|uniref:Altered inheritance of mitochondria protein 11 n=1 Tax=Bionectria ochroleuca TaxID=29856 RepID=A0ABY6UT32_BIOOC|nr:unnamed protein product [Clonostachys rosea]